MTIDPGIDRGYRRYQEQRREFWNNSGTAKKPLLSRYYHRRLAEICQFLIPPGLKILEIGSGSGDLIAALRPSRGLGIDFSEVLVENAQDNHPELEFRLGDAHELDLDEKFDVVILSDLINDVWDVETVLRRVKSACSPNTRLVINSFNRLWQGPIALARLLRLANPVLRQNWLARQDIRNLLKLTGFEEISVSGEIVAPLNIPIVSAFLNKVVAKIWPFSRLTLTSFFVARPIDLVEADQATPPSVSVIVPARNEAGHIHDILERTPNMGSHTEILFVEGNSTDDTYEVIERELAARSDPRLHLYRQPGKGKGDAVRFGYQHATGDILMILDADMTVAPEDLPRFYRAISQGSGEFINGVRLVYPMEEEAMRFLNYLGNKFFGLVFSWLLRQPVKDTLCGTKVLTRDAYDVIASNRSYFGDFDPFGDFDLLFGAAKINLKIVDVPIRYRDREYGSTNIDRWRHGVLLLRMAAFAARRLKFI